MSELPTGTVTFLFTDIEGSSRLWELYPDTMKIALAKHDAILRQAVESNCGHIVKTTGDGLHAVFATAADGICAALSAQQALRAESWAVIHPQQIRSRMGLHTGEAEIRAGDYYGAVLNRAARLMAVGSGGQILVSNATAELLREGMPAETTLRDLGEHRLKDLARPEHIFQLLHSSLPSEFPPLKSIDSVPNNLPAQLTSFIGREKEVAAIVHLLKTTRLITLTGPGGTGKTRLAQEVSAQQLTSFPHGVWLIELAPLIDPSQIIPQIAQVLGLQENPAVPLAMMIVNYLHDKEALLILDNCEHLIDACARLADDLLRRCPQIKIIASSREALGIAGEVAFRIPSLQANEAVQLFVERACAANPSFKHSEGNASAVSRICNRLDGIPLAIELAAARSRMLSPEQIAARLDDRFHLLVGGSRTALPRQQTLRAMIDWSYDLLSDAEKTLLRTCSVFSSGWTLEALEAVSQDPNAIEHLEQLVNKSLVVAEERENETRPSEMRYALLETIRQYAREKLLESGVSEAARLRNLHLDFFKKLSEVAEERLVGVDMIQWIDRLTMEEDNLRAALEWAAESDPLAALQMAASLIYFWSRRASASEGYHLIQSVMAQAEERLSSEQKTLPDYRAARAKALVSAAGLAFGLGINQTALDMAKSAVSIAREVNAGKTLLAALNFAALSSAFVGDFPLAQACVAEALVLGPQQDYADEQALTYGLTIFLNFVKNEPFPQEALEEALRLARASGNRVVQGITLTNIGRFYSATGHFTEALAYFEEAETLYKEARDRMMYLTVRSEVGHLLRKQNRHAEAIAVYRETIQAFRETSQFPAVAHELECFAFIALGQKQLERAAILLGAAEALREQLGSEMILPERHEYAEMLSLLRGQMDEAVLARAWGEGRSMRMDQAIQLALQ